MVSIRTKRSRGLDVLKGIAIIAVVLYHSGLCAYGYLGVDVFLVIAGYFSTRSIIKGYENSSGFSYFGFLRNRLVRLWPLALVAAVVSFGLGYLWMLPMAMKNTAETAVGTSLFLNNFVQYITSSDYWDASNDYKPLMHTWYVGLLMQFYVVYPLLLIAAKRLGGGNNYSVTICMVFFVSLTLYLSPQMPYALKFYLLPCRLFEFAAGGLLAIREKNVWQPDRKGIGLVAFGLLLLLLCINGNWDNKEVKLITTVLLTCFLIACLRGLSVVESETFNHQLMSPVVFAGRASYSFFIWHQVILAFYRYVFNDAFEIIDYIVLFVLCLFVGSLSYLYLERRLNKLLHNRTREVQCACISVMMCVLLIIPSFYVYGRHGIVRDVPELDLYLNSKNNLESQDYNERNMSYDKDFPQNGKQNILVVGDSFARDWINVLRESYIDSIMNISYHKDIDGVLRRRIDEANYVFVANNAPFDVYYPCLKQMLEKIFFRVGRKFFTTRNGIVYNNDRYGVNYYAQTFRLFDDEEKNMRAEKELFADRYIDMMGVVRNSDGTYSYFTPNHHLYSHDGIHLTQAGAKEYARRMNLMELLLKTPDAE